MEFYKNKVFIVFIALALLFAVAGIIVERVNSDKEKIENNIDKNVFVPDKDLLYTEFWTRVSERRFEGSYLRLAVEWDEGVYYLIEMDGKKRILLKSSKYSVIRQGIIDKTLNIE